MDTKRITPVILLNVRIISSLGYFRIVAYVLAQVLRKVPHIRVPSVPNGCRWPDLRKTALSYVSVVQMIDHFRYASGVETDAGHRRTSASITIFGRFSSREGIAKRSTALYISTNSCSFLL